MTLQRTDDSGFTLMELMTVLLILAILVTIAFLSYIVATNNARRITCLQNQRILTGAVSVYTAEHGIDPNDVDDLEPLVRNFANAVQCPNRDGVLLEYDPLSGIVTCDNHPR